MNKIVFITLFVGSLIAAPAATPQPASDAAISTNQGISDGAMPAFTNAAGQTFSADEFAQNLKNLRSAIELTMPMVMAVTETYSNSVSKDKSWAGRASDLVSGALKRDGQQTSGQSSSRLNEVVGALGGLLKTNLNTTGASSSTNGATMQHLITLQNQLKPVLPTLDQLNVAGSASSVSSNGSSSTILTPTGR